MTQRGMAYTDRRSAILALKRAGYYRLSAYSYPFRELVGDGHEVRRSDSFLDGTTVEQVVAVHDFDAKLRAVLLQGLETLEVGLRVAIAYTLGKHDKFGHLQVASLNETTCSKPSSRDPSETEFEHWLRRYEARCSESASKDFVRHFNTSYDGQLPIWVATEVLDLGGLVRLFSFLTDTDQISIARGLGYKNARDFLSWIRSLNVLRNHCAHHSRVWNRRLSYAVTAVKRNVVPPELVHLVGMSDTERRKAYVLAALLASLVVAFDPHTNWPRTFKTVAGKLPVVPGVVDHTVMGFPQDWRELPIWNSDPNLRNAR